MTKIKLHSQGYELVVTSWENDADNYNTKTASFRTMSDLMTAVDIIKLLTHTDDNGNYRHGGVDAGDFSNLYDPTEYEIEKFREAVIPIILENPTFYFVDSVVDKETAFDYAMDFLYDLGLSHGEWFTRVVESFEIYRFAEDIYVTKVKL